MYLNHPLVPGFPLTLRYGEERDRVFLADVFAEVWAVIPEIDRSAILTRGYGRVDVDVSERPGVQGSADMGGDIHLGRAAVDTYPQNVVVHLVARELARKVDDFSKPKPVALPKELDRDAKRRITTILRRWRFPARAIPEPTPADKERIRANLAQAARGESQDDL